MILRTVPIHKSLHRPQSLFGCETTYSIVAVGLSSVIFFTQFTLVGLGWFLLAGGISLWVGRKIFKADPLYINTALASLKYKRCYPAQGTIWYCNKK